MKWIFGCTLSTKTFTNATPIVTAIVSSISLGLLLSLWLSTSQWRGISIVSLWKRSYWWQFYQLFFWWSFSYLSSNTISMLSINQVSWVEESIFLSPNKGFKLVSTIFIANSFEIVYIAFLFYFLFYFFIDFKKIKFTTFFSFFLIHIGYGYSFLLKCELNFWDEFRGMKWILVKLRGCGFIFV